MFRRYDIVGDIDQRRALELDDAALPVGGASVTWLLIKVFVALVAIAFIGRWILVVRRLYKDYDSTRNDPPL